MEKEDRVLRPKHYQIKGIEPYESIDIIRAILDDYGLVGFEAFCFGNTLKYLLRFMKKNGEEDLDKAEVYLKWFRESHYGKTNG